LKGDQYTEHLNYYSDPKWEGKTFIFTVSLQNDTLTQRGTEKVEKKGLKERSLKSISGQRNNSAKTIPAKPLS
jgi:hypothetical protein